MSDKKQNRMRMERKIARQAERRRPHIDKYANLAKKQDGKEAPNERR